MALGVLVGDFDNDGWPDIYVADDSAPSALFKNNHDGTFTDIALEAGVAFGADGKTQAGMGVSAADIFGNGQFAIFKTNFAGDASSLYRNLGDGNFEDMTFQAGLGRNTRFLGWGACFLDFDNDGWPDILTATVTCIPRCGRRPANPAIASARCSIGILATANSRMCRSKPDPGFWSRWPAAAALSATSITMAIWMW